MNVLPSSEVNRIRKNIKLGWKVNIGEPMQRLYSEQYRDKQFINDFEYDYKAGLNLFKRLSLDFLPDDLPNLIRGEIRPDLISSLYKFGERSPDTIPERILFINHVGEPFNITYKKGITYPAVKLYTKTLCKLLYLFMGRQTELNLYQVQAINFHIIHYRNLILDTIFGNLKFTPYFINAPFVINYEPISITPNFFNINYQTKEDHFKSINRIIRQNQSIIYPYGTQLFHIGPTNSFLLNEENLSEVLTKLNFSSHSHIFSMTNAIPFTNEGVFIFDNVIRRCFGRYHDLYFGEPN